MEAGTAEATDYYCGRGRRDGALPAMRAVPRRPTWAEPSQAQSLSPRESVTRVPGVPRLSDVPRATGIFRAAKELTGSAPVASERYSYWGCYRGGATRDVCYLWETNHRCFHARSGRASGPAVLFSASVAGHKSRSCTSNRRQRTEPSTPTGIRPLLRFGSRDIRFRCRTDRSEGTCAHHAGNRNWVGLLDFGVRSVDDTGWVCEPPVPSGPDKEMHWRE
jgi:hypothetical protein